MLKKEYFKRLGKKEKFKHRLGLLCSRILYQSKRRLQLSLFRLSIFSKQCRVFQNQLEHNKSYLLLLQQKGAQLREDGLNRLVLLKNKNKAMILLRKVFRWLKTRAFEMRELKKHAFIGNFLVQMKKAKKHLLNLERVMTVKRHGFLKVFFNTLVHHHLKNDRVLHQCQANQMYEAYEEKVSYLNQ